MCKLKDTECCCHLEIKIQRKPVSFGSCINCHGNFDGTVLVFMLGNFEARLCDNCMEELWNGIGIHAYTSIETERREKCRTKRRKYERLAERKAEGDRRL